MAFFTFRQVDRVRPNRTPRELRPSLESFERRQLLSGATITGTTYQDLAGNGAFSDTSRLAGVTVDLYQNGSSTVLEKITTDKNGNYSFTNLAPGNYLVQQVDPSNFIPTGANLGYQVTLKSGQTAPGKDFEDFQLNPLPVLNNLSFIVTTPSGKSTTVSSLHGNVQQGDTVTAKFSVATSQTLTLVSYTAPNNDFDTNNLQKQEIFSESTVKTTGAGSKSLKVTVPDGYFQLDFVGGLAIDHLATNSNVLYHAQDRYIDGQTGGTQPDAPASTSTTPTPATSSNGMLSTSTLPISMINATNNDVVVAGITQARKH